MFDDNKKQVKALVTDKTDSNLRDLLYKSHFSIVHVESSHELLNAAIDEKPAIIIGDLKSLDRSVKDVCQMLRNHHLARHIPLIVVSDQDGVADRISAMESGVTDYIVKPYDEGEVVARIQRSIQNMKMALDANPLTRLPGNICIRENMEHRLSENERFIVAYIDLDHFKSYNDLYGYAAGDDVIALTADTLIQCQQELDPLDKQSFLGHVGGDDFIMIGPEPQAEIFCEDVIEKFDKAIQKCYEPKTWEKGYVIGRDRKGQTTTIPHVSLSIAVVVNSQGHKFKHVGEIAGAGAEIKKYLKSISGSAYLVDRRDMGC